MPQKYWKNTKVIFIFREGDRYDRKSEQKARVNAELYFCINGRKYGDQIYALAMTIGFSLRNATEASSLMDFILERANVFFTHLIAHTHFKLHLILKIQ